MTATDHPASWDRFLLAVVATVTVYAFALVVAVLSLGDQVFDRLGFGPDDGAIASDDSRQHLRPIYAILGSVIIGRMLTITALVTGPLRRREAWAWKAIAAGVGAWFLLDTGLALILGFVGHADSTWPSPARWPSRSSPSRRSYTLTLTRPLDNCARGVAA